MDKSNKIKSISNIDFYKYFQKIIGNKLSIYVLFNLFVGLLDGIGLTLFIPLMAVATGTESSSQNLGKLDVLPKFFDWVGIPMTLFSVLGMMVLLFTGKGILSYIRDIYFIKMRLSSIRKIRIRLLDSFKKMTYRGYTQSDPGKIQFAMVGETARLVKALNTFVTSIRFLIVMFTYVVLAFLANWQFALLVSIGGLASNLLYSIINQRTKKVAQELSKEGNTFNRYLIQAIENFKYLKATNNFSKYQKNLNKSIHEFEHVQYQIGKLNTISANLREPIIMVVISLVILLQITVFGGSFASILIGLLLFYRALSSLVSFQNSWNIYLGNAAGLEAIINLEKEFSSSKEPEQIGIPFEKIGDIELKNISLSYEDAQIIKDLSIVVPSKSTIALVGESGAGKTTLANIIGGLVNPSSGEVLVNDKPFLANQIESYRNKVGYISQEPTIFNDTIYNNVTFWAPKTRENMERFYQAMELVHLLPFLDDLEKREDAPLGNNGILISGGQKQRISIARELFRDVDLLIMDEATSALDSETEQIIKENIDSLHGKYTIVIIAHRLSTIKNADLIYLLDKGELIQSGPFQELYHKDEVFKRMVDLQEV